jgi:hypothetical protein
MEDGLAGRVRNYADSFDRQGDFNPLNDTRLSAPFRVADNSSNIAPEIGVVDCE